MWSGKYREYIKNKKPARTEIYTDDLITFPDCSPIDLWKRSLAEYYNDTTAIRKSGDNDAKEDIGESTQDGLIREDNSTNVKSWFKCEKPPIITENNI